MRLLFVGGALAGPCPAHSGTHCLCRLKVLAVKPTTTQQRIAAFGEACALPRSRAVFRLAHSSHPSAAGCGGDHGAHSVA